MSTEPTEAEVEAALRHWYGRGDWKSFYFPPRTRPAGGDLRPWDELVVDIRFERMRRAIKAAAAVAESKHDRR